MLQCSNRRNRKSICRALFRPNKRGFLITKKFGPKKNSGIFLFFLLFLFFHNEATVVKMKRSRRGSTSADNLTFDGPSPFWSTPPQARPKFQLSPVLVPRRHKKKGSGAPKKPFDQCHPDVQDRKLKQLSSEIVEMLEKHLATKEAALANAWRNAHPNIFEPVSVDPLSHSTLFSTLCGSISEFYASIPANSPIRSSVVKTLFANIPADDVTHVLPISSRAVYFAFASEIPLLPHFLRELGFPRDRLGEQETWVLHWLEQFCPFPSGRSKRYFLGTPSSMYSSYLTWALSNEHPTVSPTTFESIRRMEHIGVQLGDKFMSQDRIRLAAIEKHLLALESSASSTPADIISLQQEVAQLRANVEWATSRKAAYRQAHLELESKPSTMVVTADFTSSDTSPEDEFVNFILVVATQSELEIPDSLLDALIEPEDPISSLSLASPLVSQKQARRTKKELLEAGVTPPTPVRCHTRDIKEAKKKQRLTANPHVTASSFKPVCTYFHFVAKKSDDVPITQTLPYVRWCLEFLFLKHNLAASFTEIQLWSDGCGKHFKVYATQYFISTLQQHLCQSVSPSFRIHWNFLPPRDAHNRADAAAAHWKRAHVRLLRNYCIVNSLGHLAFSCSRLSRAYLIEAVFADFPEPPSVHVNDDNRFMRNAYTFSYSNPYVAPIICKHLCSDKASCGHICCKENLHTLVDLTVTFRDGSTGVHKLCLATAEEVDSLDELQEILVESSYLAPSAPVRTSVSCRFEDFSYDNELDSVDETDFLDADDTADYQAIAETARGYSFCNMCTKKKPHSDFSSSQLKRRADLRRCKVCIEVAFPHLAEK